MIMKKDNKEEELEVVEEDTFTAEEISKLIDDAVETAIKEYLPKEEKPKEDKKKKVTKEVEDSKEDLLEEIDRLKKENEQWRESFNNSSHNTPVPKEDKLVKGWGKK